MKVNGKMICSMEKELRLGPTKVSTRANMHLAESTESELINGMMEVSTQVIGGKTK